MSTIEGEKNLQNQELATKENNIKLFFEQVASTIGGDVTPERVEKVIKNSNAGRHIFHGIKREIFIEGVKNEGIKPLTPEGGMASYWTSGQRLFGELKKDGSLQTYDSSFFHYGHTETTSKRKEALMTMAISNSHELCNILNIEVKDDDYLTINSQVPRNKIFLIEIRMDLANIGNLTGREVGMKLEQKMFDCIEDALKNGYGVGEGIEIRI